jgi:hypothetical protein
MKKMNKNIIILLFAALLLGNSCEEFLSVNEVNPNNASKVPTSLLLPDALNSVARTMNNPRRFEFVYLWHGLWSISAGYSQPQNLVQYKLLNSNYQNAFNEFYLIGQNLTEIEKVSAADAKESNYLAVAKIMKAYIFQNLVDCWGDVPYTEAFDALNNLKPKYDDQQGIYEDLVVQLDDAMDLIQNAPGDATAIPVSSDIMYGGNMDLWLKFANTLKLRILLHQSGMDGRTSYITGALATTSSIGFIGAGEGGLVNPGFLVSEAKMNPFYETFYNAAGSAQSDASSYYYAGSDAVNFLQANLDPRIGKFFKSTSTTSAVYGGNIFGTNTANLKPASSTSQLGYASDPEDAGTMVGTPTKSAPLLTDFESLFIQAEAAERGLISGDAKGFYEAAITQSFVYMGFATGEAVNYFSQENGNVNYTVATDKLSLILTQKWASLNGIAPVEIWTDFRRTGIPDFIHWSVDPNVVNITPPIRLLYPQTEISTNNDQLLQVGPIDAFTSKIFWQNR